MKAKNIKTAKNIVLIGAGNIGSRHLQGIKKVNRKLNIFVIDPSNKSLEIARERYDQVLHETTHNIVFENSLNSLPTHIDVAIIATSSKVRSKVITELLSKSKVKYLILEKWLFSNPADYKKMSVLISNHKTKTWVNCAMRTQPFYKDLKKEIGKSKVFLTVTGSNFGLITNTIHFVDYLSYLSGDYSFSIDASSLKVPIKSKREGYSEMNGLLTVSFKNGSKAFLYSIEEGNLPIVIEIVSNNIRVVSQDSLKKALISKEKDFDWTENETDVPYQSDMTNKIIENLLKTGKCDLAPFEVSVKTHLQLIKPLISHINKHSRSKVTEFNFT